MRVVRALESLALVSGLLLASHAATPCRAQTAPAEPIGQAEASSVLTNVDVVQMLRSGFADSTVIAVIQKAKTRFDLTSAALAELRYAGVPDSVIVAMVESAGAAPNAPAPPAPTPAPPAPVVAAPPPVVVPAPPPPPEPRPFEGVPEPERPSRPHVSFKLGGGASYLAVGDYKNLYDSLNDTYSATYDNYQLDAPQLGFNVSADVIFHITRVFGIGLGAGYLRASKDSTLSDSSGSSSWSEDGSLTVSAIPIRLGIHVFIPFSSRIEGFVNVSPTLYLAKAREAYQGSGYGSYSYNYDGEVDVSATQPAFGVEGALGLKVNLGSVFSLFLEVGGRYAKLSPFEGSYHYAWWDSTDGPSNTDRSNATLYTYEYLSSSDSAWHKSINAWENEPSGSTYRNVSEANVDFSGAQFRFGFAISF